MKFNIGTIKQSDYKLAAKFGDFRMITIQEFKFFFQENIEIDVNS